VRVLRLCLWPAGAVLGIAAESAQFDWSQPDDWLPDLAVGWTFIACGLLAWHQRPETRCGLLLAATGFTWFAANFASDAALYLHRGPLIQLVLSYPGGRLGRRLDRLAVAIGYGAALIPAVWSSEAATFALVAFFVMTAIRGYARAVGQERRRHLVGLEATLFLAALLAGTAAGRLAFRTPEATDATLWVYEVGLCTLALGLFVGLVREPWARTEVADLVVDLGDARPGMLRDALAQALGDPTLEIGYRFDQGYVDSQGRALVLPASGSARKVTPVERDGEALAVLIHDPAVLDDPGLSDSLARAARLAASNARLQAEVRAQVEELDASRRRLVQAGDDERRRLELRLRDTVERRLMKLARKLEGAHAGRLAAARTETAREQLARVLDELRELAAGLHPASLTDGSLSDALSSLVARSPIPVELRLDDTRLPDELATTTYFVCAEALANVIKYACASKVVISVAQRASRLSVEVVDDGMGGAVVGAGTGLPGLADRVEALGGTLRVDSPRGGGTRVVAELPLAITPTPRQ
jgi:signal transduction histidine kinase